MKYKIIYSTLFFSLGIWASPLLQMNKAFNSVLELMPMLRSNIEYNSKKNEEIISKNLESLYIAFKDSRHDGLIKHDLFAPSYKLISENLKEVMNTFKNEKKDYSRWIMNKTLTLCMDCHGRLPTSLTSSFQNGELTVNTSKLDSPFEIGLSFLIVRRYVDAKASFTRHIQDNIIKKESLSMMASFKQILMIESKINKDPSKMISIIDDYESKNNLPQAILDELNQWKKRLLIWKEEKSLKGVKTEKELKQFIKRRLTHIEKKESFNDAFQVDLLFAGGILSNYFFENQNSSMAPEISYWIGFIEKRLKKENFLSSGDLFLKQCIQNYPSHPYAKKCLNEYRESIEFDFSGSRGTDIPKEIKEQFKELENLLRETK